MRVASLMSLLLAAFLSAQGIEVRFRSPTDTQRISAIGPTADLPERLRRALQPRGDFQPMPYPGPNDWLANHPERGQSFEQFAQSHPNRPDDRRKKLYLQPLADFTEGEGPPLDQLRLFMSSFFVMEVHVSLPLVQTRNRIMSRRNPRTGQVQLLTGDILNLLRTQLPEDAFALLGVTMTDLYPHPSWNFVFGQASPQERVGVYSFARYDPSFYGNAFLADSHKLVLRRSCRVVAHETGHMFGFEHCIWYRCLMNGSNHLAEADTRPLHLCPVDLRKLQNTIGFNVLTRYRRLHDFCLQAGFEDEARWLKNRIGFIGVHTRDGETR